MAQGNFRAYLKGDVVSVKKYFYVLRPILAMNWIEKGMGTVPMDFNVLASQLVTEPLLKQKIHDLLEAKRAGAELDQGPRIAPISEFIEKELERWEQQEIPDRKEVPASDKLDALLRESLAEIW